MEKVGDTDEWAPRARHHAKRLLTLAQVAHDIFERATEVKFLKSRLRVYTPRATYIIRPYRDENGEYIGIEIKEYGRPASVRLVVDES